MPTLIDLENVIPFPAQHSAVHDETPATEGPGVVMALPVGQTQASSSTHMDMKRILKDISERLLDSCDPAFIQILNVERYQISRATDAYNLSCQVRLANGRVYAFTAEKKPCRFRSFVKGVHTNKTSVPMERFSLVRERTMLDNWFPVMGIQPLEDTTPASLHLTLMDLSSVVDEGPVRHILMEGTQGKQFAHVREQAGENGSVSRTAYRTRHLFHLLSKAVARHMSSLN